MGNSQHFEYGRALLSNMQEAFFELLVSSGEQGKRRVYSLDISVRIQHIKMQIDLLRHPVKLSRRRLEEIYESYCLTLEPVIESREYYAQRVPQQSMLEFDYVRGLFEREYERCNPHPADRVCAPAAAIR